MTQLRNLNISCKSYRNQLNLDVLSHLTSLRINENKKYLLKIFLNKSWYHSCFNCTMWIIINNFIIFKLRPFNIFYCFKIWYF